MHSFCSGRQKLAAIADFAVRNGTIYGPAMYETPIETVNFCSHIEHDPAKIQSGHWKGNPLIPDDERALLTASTRTKTPKDGLTVLLNAFGQIQGRLAEQEEVYVPHFDNAYFTLEPMHPFVLGYSPLRRPDHAIVAKQIGSAIRGAIPVFGKRRMREYADYLNGLVRAA
jgi:hypothetical protein